MKKKFDVLMTDEAKEFVKSLDIKDQRKVLFNIQRSRQVNDPKILKKLDDEIWEFRTRFEKLQIRLLAFWYPKIKSLIICSHGFIKKTDRIPKKEFRKEYLNLKK